jgi:hypothetical protein
LVLLVGMNQSHLQLQVDCTKNISICVVYFFEVNDLFSNKIK